MLKVMSQPSNTTHNSFDLTNRTYLIVASKLYKRYEQGNYHNGQKKAGKRKATDETQDEISYHACAAHRDLIGPRQLK